MKHEKLVTTSHIILNLSWNHFCPLQSDSENYTIRLNTTPPVAAAALLLLFCWLPGNSR